MKPGDVEDAGLGASYREGNRVTDMVGRGERVRKQADSKHGSRAGSPHVNESRDPRKDARSSRR